MSDHLYIAKEPTHVPLRWLLVTIGICGGMLASSIYIGSWVQGIDSRLEASEKDRTLLFDIQHRLSVIEGKIDIIRRDQ